MDKSNHFDWRTNPTYMKFKTRPSVAGQTVAMFSLNVICKFVLPRLSNLSEPPHEFTTFTTAAKQLFLGRIPNHRRL